MAKFIDLAGLKAALAKVKTYSDEKDAAIVGQSTDASSALTLNGLKALITEKTNGIATDENLEALTGRVSTLEGKHATGKTVAEEVADGITGKVDAVEGKGLSTNDFTDAFKTKLEGLEAGGQVNVIESVKVNGTALVVANKAVDVLVATGTTNGTIAVNGTDVAVKGLGSAAYKADTAFDAAGAADGVKTAIETKIGTLPEGSDTVVAAIEAAKAAATYDDAALAGRVTALEGKHTAGKTVAEEVADGIATVVANAPADFDTLKEIADWIANDTTGSAKMANDIATLKTTVGDDASGLVKDVADLKALAGTDSVADQVKAAVEALDVTDAAVAGKYVSAVSETDGKITVTREDLPVIPESLKNPNALTIKDNVDTNGVVYDGSAAQTFEAETVTDVETAVTAILA